MSIVNHRSLFILILCVFLNAYGYAQNKSKSDTVYIKLIKGRDKINHSKVFKMRVFQISDPNFEKRMEWYRKKIDDSNNPLILPYLPKPNKYFSCYQVKEVKYKKKRYLSRIEFYDRHRLGELDPNKQNIYIVKIKNDSIALFEVSYSKLVIE